MSTWKTCKLGDVADVATGNSNREDAVEGGKYPLYDRSPEVKRSNRYLFDFPAGAVIVPGEGQAFVPRFALGKFDLHQRAYAVSPKHVRGNTLEVNAHYLYYSLMDNRDYFARVATGSTVKSLRQWMFHEMPISLPPLSEQERIAGVLGVYDDLIAVNERRMALLEEAAHRLWRDRFVTHADPAWPSRPIKDCCATIQSGGTPSRGDETLWTGGTIDWFKTKELQDSWLLSSEEKITERAVQQSAARLYPAGAILMAIYASPTLGRLGVLSREATCNQAALGFVVDEAKASKWWLFYTLLEERERFNQVARGAGQQNISGEIVKGWAVRTPPLSVALTFEREVTPYWMAFLTLSRENALLREGRDGLLPRLLREEA